MTQSTSEADLPGSLGHDFAEVLTGCALVDLSDFGRIELAGQDRLDLIHRLSTSDLLGARAGELRPTIFLSEKGRIIDRVLLFVTDSNVLMVTSPGATTVDLRWIERFTITEEVATEDVTSETSMYCIIGTEVDSVVARIFGVSLGPNTWQHATLGTVETIIGLHANSRETIGYLITDSRHAPELWNMLTTPDVNIHPVGPRVYDAHRINRGIPAWGHELTERFTPLDVGLREDISFSKGCYIGQEVIARLDTYKKVHRHLAGLVFRGNDPGGVGQSLFSEGKEIGVITSVMSQPVQARYLGLGVVENTIASERSSVVTTTTGAEGVIARFPIVSGGQ